MVRTTSVLRALAALAVCGALIGCGDGDDIPDDNDAFATSGPADGPSDDDGAAPGDGAAGVDACSLVTTDEVAEVLQEARPDDANFSATAEQEELGEGSVCLYSWQSDFATGSFEISVFPATNYVAFGEPEPIEGIADEAFEDNDNFYAQRGDLMVHVVNVQQGRDADIELLRIAAERLPG